MPSAFTKDPQAVLDYKFDWAALTNGSCASDWLDDGETISSKTASKIIKSKAVNQNKSIMTIKLPASHKLLRG